MEPSNVRLIYGQIYQKGLYMPLFTDILLSFVSLLYFPYLGSVQMCDSGLITLDKKLD